MRQSATPAVEVPSAPAATSETGAAELYVLGEARVAAGDFDAGIALLHRSLLTLPPTGDHDDTRHALLLRLAYVQLVASAQTGQKRYAEAARTMLLRYADKHHALFGDTEPAQAQRADVFELLHEVERFVEPPPADTERAPAPTNAVPERESDDAPSDAPIRRRVVVKTDKLASLDDPRVKPRLQHRFSDAQSGAVLTRGEIAEVHGARALVRVEGPILLRSIPEREDRAALRTALRGFVDDHRERWRRCYTDLLGRDPREVARVTLELVTDREGTLTRVRPVAADFRDPVTATCMVDGLQGRRLGSHSRAGLRIELPLVMFVQGSVEIVEHVGTSAPSEVITFDLPPLPNGPGLQFRDIEDFDHPSRPIVVMPQRPDPRIEGASDR